MAASIAIVGISLFNVCGKFSSMKARKCEKPNVYTPVYILLQIKNLRYIQMCQE